MKRIAGFILIVLFVAGSVSVASSKSKIWDLIFDDKGTTEGSGAGTAQGGTGGAARYTVEIKMADGETFRIATTESDYSDVVFGDNMKLEQPDGTYYINTGQVQYIRVLPR